jgi:hypothetical protein
MKTLTNAPPPHPHPPIPSNPPPFLPQPPLSPFHIPCPSCSASRSWMLLNEAGKGTIKEKEQSENVD